jgi:hypothetical protein
VAGPGTFYFAWCGGAPIPGVELNTKADIWSGSFVTTAIVWGGFFDTRGDINQLTALENIPISVVELGIGTVYKITGPGIPSILDGAAADTTFTYTGNGAGTLSQNCVLGTNVAVRLSNPAGTSAVVLGYAGPLVMGRTYGIAGSGLPPDNTFVYEGSLTIALLVAATATGHISVTITSELDVGIISNLADITDLVAGTTYNAFALGLPAGAQATYGGGNSLTLLGKPTVTNVGIPINISKGKTYPDGGPFDPDVHLVEDLQIFDIELSQTEGGFAALVIQVLNPRIGLLAAGQNLWCWLSWTNAEGTVIPLFHGRLVGIPKELEDEVVSLEFIARPGDFIAQKLVAAAAMQVLPWWDPVWLIDKIDDPDTVLETYSRLWDISPITLTVTATDLTTGEDGTIVVGTSEHFYDAMSVAYGAAPLRQVNVSGTVTWTQAANGDVDLTQSLVSGFITAGSPYVWPKISSYTAPGLLAAWPLPGASFGGGWTIGTATTAAILLTIFKDLNVTYSDKTGAPSYTLTGGPIPAGPEGDPGGFSLIPEWSNYEVGFTLGVLSVNLSAHYEASRKRTEVAGFSVTAEVQSILTDPLAADDESISLSSAFVDQGVDPGGAIPIGDVRKNCYFPTDRGQASIQYLMLLARAKLLLRARAVDIMFASTWEKLAGIVTCRKNVTLYDDRLPGGQATGKVKSYKLSWGESAIVAEATIGCTIGYGDTITPSAGVDSYADNYSTGYDEAPGSQVSVTPDLVYQSMDGAYVIDDDGVDFFNMTPGKVIIELLIAGGPKDQEAAIDAALAAPGMAAIEVGAAFPGDTLYRFRGGKMSGLSAKTFTTPATYVITIASGKRFTVTGGPLSGSQGLLGAPFSGGGLSFTLADGTVFPFLPGDTVSVTVTKEAADSVGVVPDPIGALAATPTSITLDLVPVTGGDFESDYTLLVQPIAIPQTINLESASVP